MATPKGTRATLVKLAQVEEAYTFLKSLPEKSKEDLSLKEAINKLREPLQDALAKGYSYQDLAKQLEKQGINISATTLKNYLPSGKRTAKGQSPTTTRKRAAKRVLSDSPATSVTSSTSAKDSSSRKSSAGKATQPSARGAKTQTTSKTNSGKTTGQSTPTTRTRSTRSAKK